MKSTAIVFDAPGQVSLKTLELPDINERDVLVEVVCSGVSVGTERWAYLGKRDEVTFPNIPGYMGIGRVTKCGDQAAALGYAVGDHVNFFQSRLPEPYTGSWMGSHLSHAVVDVVAECEQNNPEELDVHRCLKLPEGLDPIDAALTQLCGVALRGIEMATIPAGANVLVSGVGAIGQLAAQICRLKGARVVVADVVPSRLDIARQCGVEMAVNVKTQSLADVTATFAPNGFDVIIDTSSQPSVVNGLLPLLRFRGKFVFQGWYPPPSSLDLNAMQSRMATCYFPCAHSGAAVAAAMRLTADGHLQVRPLISHVVSPHDAVEIYRMLDQDASASLGVVFDWGQL